MNHPPLDLNALQSTYGEEGCTEILSLFIKEVSDLLALSAKHVAAQDQNGLARTGHQLKGLSTFIISSEMEDLSRRLEDCASSGDWEGAQTLLDRLNAFYNSVTVFIKSHLSNPGK
jgi:HPt (histidine-containing phosphotransfer) domain-containing protein